MLFFVGAASAMVVRRRSVQSADRSRHAPVQCINIVCGRRRRPILRYWRLAVAADIWNSLHAALRMRTCRDTSKFGTHYPWTRPVDTGRAVYRALILLLSCLVNAATAAVFAETINVKKRFYVFILVTFLRFLTFFLIFCTFLK